MTDLLRVTDVGDHAFVHRCGADAVDLHGVALGLQSVDGLLGGLLGRRETRGCAHHPDRSRSDRHQGPFHAHQPHLFSHLTDLDGVYRTIFPWIHRFGNSIRSRLAIRSCR
ncbi:hypothetical protein MSMEI_5152 [Mycolicibacterium smegmatis MC2 155]|uniref:Uncharacterized protein n=1 Tax=Mycolicibacterium smegmatis (strain ATCC 700084 / mc(2)155) TaxID=246196 RepID=I7GDV4_MYCS2|nr:hypothetical protein MSMEI_5152 [Mycolicibacterium smegmatis MC2 155]